MKSCFVSYAGEEAIPVAKYLHNRKLGKYFSRETRVAVICAARLLEGISLPPETPFYYAAGLLAYEEYGLSKLVKNSLTDDRRFSNERFVKSGLPGISPLTSFKCLPNMALAFISVEQGLRGDNAVFSTSAATLLAHALLAPTDGPMLIGAGEADSSGQAAACFSLASREELNHGPRPDPNEGALSFLRKLSLERAP